MRNTITQALDSQSTVIGDVGFYWVNQRLDPSLLSPGLVTDGINVRFRNGIAETRRGFVILPWLNKITSGFTQPWGTVYGIGLFSDPVTLIDYTLIAADGNVYYTTENASPNTLTLPTGISVTSRVQFEQAFDSVVMFRGTDDDPLAMSSILSGFSAVTETPTTMVAGGTTAYVTMPQDHGFTSGDTVRISGLDQAGYNGSFAVTVTGPKTFTYTTTGSFGTPTGSVRVNSDGTEPIPNADRGLFFQNRILIPNDNDELAISDFGSYTKYLPVVQELKINVGSSDRLVTVSKFSDNTVIAFKEHSIYALNNFYGGLSGVTQDQITDEFGLVAADSVAKCGADLLFLSQMGVMSLRQTEQNKIQGVSLPLSDPIQPLIDRINWKYATNAKAAYWDNKYYLAVPLDSAEAIGQELAYGRYGDLGGSGQLTMAVVAGATYRFTKGSETVSLVNGTQTLTYSSDFTAQGSTIYLAVSVPLINTPTTCSIRRIRTGVNNAILVYDFLNQAWAGYDQADGLTVKFFHVRKHRDIDRLFVVTEDGFIFLYEEDYEDQLAVPYTDVVVSSVPSNGGTITVNGGTTITVNTGSASNGAATWGVQGATVASALERLWTDGSYGYAASSLTAQWSAPNTTVALIATVTSGALNATAVRFYATNGRVPTVTITGSNPPTRYEHSQQQIESTITTRGYSVEVGSELSNYDWLTFDIQTWNPDYSVTLVMDGVEENRTVSSSVTKSRTRYTVFGRADYDPTNTSLDHATDFREDYSILVGNDGTSSFSIDTSSADPARHQEFMEGFKVRQRGRSARVKFESTQGRIRLATVRFENRRVNTKAGSKT